MSKDLSVPLIGFTRTLNALAVSMKAHGTVHSYMLYRNEPSHAFVSLLPFNPAKYVTDIFNIFHFGFESVFILKSQVG